MATGANGQWPPAAGHRVSRELVFFAAIPSQVRTPTTYDPHTTDTTQPIVTDTDPNRRLELAMIATVKSSIFSLIRILDGYFIYLLQFYICKLTFSMAY